MTHRYPLDRFIAVTGVTLRASAESQRDWRSRGLTERTAERFAVDAGYHPYVIWPEMLDHAIADTAHLPDVDESPAEALRRKQRDRHARLMARRQAA